MKKKKNNFIRFAGGFTVLIVGLLILLATINKESSADQILDEVFSGNEAKLLYLARPGCSWCQKASPILEKVESLYNFEHYYINTEKLNSSELKSVLQNLNIDINEFGTPTFVVVNKGQIIDSNIGFMDETKLISFLKNSGIIDSSRFGE